MGVIGPRWTCPYCGEHFEYKSSAVLCYETVCFTQVSDAQTKLEEYQ